MKLIAPYFYPQFKCIADRCRHTCCVGWEIDIDASALERYARVDGPLGEKLQENIISGECPHFRLTSDERCPFLTKDNLCELILTLGEDSLCQICTDHPRFRNSFADHTEIGLGLCCESAAQLILKCQEPFHTIVLQQDDTAAQADPFETLILAVREHAFELIRDRSQPVAERVETLLYEFDIRMPEKSISQWADFLLALEQLNPAWSRLLHTLKDSCISVPSASLSDFELSFEQLISYFLYRHLPGAQDEADIKAGLGFAVLSYQIIRALCLCKAENGGCTFNDLIEFARLYSSEIEYSEENTEEILDILWESNRNL